MKLTMRWMMGVSSAAAVAMASVALAHPDDPKGREVNPRYEGPGFRLSAGGTARVFDANGTDQSRPEAGQAFPSLNMTLLGWVTVPEFGAQSFGSDCWGYVSPSGREYAMIGLSDGTGFVEITNPTNPQIIDVKSGPNSIWRDIKIYGHHAYAVSEGGQGIQVFDLSDIDNGTVTFVTSITTGGSAATHNVAINEDSGYLYRTGGSGNGLRIYSLADPANPVFVTSWPDRYVHDAQIVSYTEGPYAGREIAFCCSGFNNGGTETGIDILDVTDKGNIIQMARYQYPSGAYSHQGWLSADKQYFFLNDEQDELNYGVTSRMHIIDVSDLNNPIEATTFTNGSTAITHNLYVRDNLVFAANYASGVRVFDVTNPTSPSEIAYFDTFPSGDPTGYSSLWSNYPFFPSGVIIGSDREKGLFIWWLGDPPLTFDYPQGRPELLDPSGGTMLTVEVQAGGGDVVDDSVLLHYDLGAGFESVAMSDAGGGQYQAAFPAAECAQVVPYFITAESTVGFVLQDPPGAPDSTFAATVATSIDIGFSDDMEADLGWTVGAPGDDATTGIWTRVDPNGTAAQPEDDNPDGTGTKCWITGQGSVGGGIGDNDVDGGSTTLVSPTLDALGGDHASLVYYRWYSNDQGNSPNLDSMPVSISNDNGATWVLVEDVNENAGAWVRRSVNIADYVTPTDEIRVRFVARDLGDGSIVEAGVDDVRIVYVACEDGVVGDLDGDGNVGPADLAILLGQWGPCGGCSGDLDGDGNVGPGDLAILLGNWD